MVYIVESITNLRLIEGDDRFSEEGLDYFGYPYEPEEWEYEIPINDAEEMLKLCEEGLIDKTRYLVKVGNHVFEVDEFYGENEGLLIAEVELESEDEQFEKPEWLGEEVTGNVRYYNSFLSMHPYKNWNSLND